VTTGPNAHVETTQEKSGYDMADNKNSNRGFASMDDEKQKEIARKGGESVPDEKRSFSQDPELASEAGRKGGQESGGNFKNDPERAAEAGRKGGQESGGNFANDRERAAEAGRKGGESRGG
jgi:general stress protein YciG